MLFGVLLLLLTEPTLLTAQTCIDPPAKMVGWWTADSTASDITVYHNNGTLHGGATYTTLGKVGKAFSLLGDSDYVTVSNDPSLNFGTGDFSIDAWINTSSLDGNALTIIDKRGGDVSNPTGYSFFIYEGRLGFQLGDGSATFNYISPLNDSLNNGHWRHVAVTVKRNSTSGGILYVDGHPDFTFDPTNRPGNTNNGSALWIGQREISFPVAFGGKIDEAEVYSRALDSSEIRLIFQAGGFGKCRTGTIMIQCAVDINGDGIKNIVDVSSLPLSAFANFEIKKNGLHLKTDTLGNSIFAVIELNLDFATYTIEQVGIPAGWIQTLGGRDTIVLNGVGADTIGYMDFKLTKASGQKFRDLDSNGVKDTSEPRLSGWTINVSGDVRGNPNAVTDANGNWEVDSIAGGPHSISELQQPDWVQTAPAAGVYTFNGTSANIPGAIQTGKDFGNFRSAIPPTFVSGVVFYDSNQNHSKDPTEWGIRDWAVELTLPGGPTAMPPAITDANGNYSFIITDPGAYEVHEILKDNFNQTYPGSTFYSINVGNSGASITGLDFGNFILTDQDSTRKEISNIVSRQLDTINNPNSDMYTYHLQPHAAAQGLQIADVTDDVLPVGTVVYSFDGTTVYPVTRPVYFYWVDLTGGLMFSHPCRYYFEDKARVIDSVDTDWWPIVALPGQPPDRVWHSWEERFTSPDRVFHHHTSALPGNRPASLRSPIQDASGPQPRSPSTTLTHTYALLLGGKSDSAVAYDCFQHNLDSVLSTLTGGAMPAVNLTNVIKRNNASFATLDSAFHTLKDSSCDTLYFYYTGDRSTKDGGSIVLNQPFNNTVADSTLARYMFDTLNPKLNRLHILVDASIGSKMIKDFMKVRLPLVSIVASTGFTEPAKDGLLPETLSTYTKYWNAVAKNVSPLRQFWRPLNDSVQTVYPALDSQHPHDSSNAPYFSPNPASLTFDTIAVGGNQSKDVSIRNRGWISMSIDSIRSSDTADFTVTGPETGTIDQNDEKSFTITFHPREGIPKGADMIFYYNGENPSSIVHVSGVGLVVSDTLKYRSFVQDSLAITKPFKKKPYGTKFKALFINDTGSPKDSLIVKFSMTVDSISATKFTTKIHSDDPEWKFTGVTIAAGESVKIVGIGKNPRLVNIKKWNWHDVLKGGRTIVLPYMIPTDSQQLLLHMPLTAHVRDEVFRQGGFGPAKGRLVLGTVRSDSLRHYGWMVLDRLLDWKKYFPQNGQARRFEVFKTVPPVSLFLGEKKDPKATAYNNHLSAELAALKIGIVASQLGITPRGLDVLVYDDHISSNPLNRLTLDQITGKADTALTLWKLFPQPAAYYDTLDSVMSRINRAFSGPIDTISWAPELKVKGEAEPRDIPYIEARASAVPKQIKPLDHQKILPEEFALLQNYPNPFNPTTTVSFVIGQPSLVTLKVYDLLGREVASLLDREAMDEGVQDVEFDASNFASGVYFYRVIAETIDDLETGTRTGEKFVSVKKMVLLK